MQYSKPTAVRLLSAAIAFIFLLVSITAGTQQVDASSGLKVTPKSKTIYVGKTVTLKANKKVKWSIPKKNKTAKLISVKKKSVKVKGLKKGTVYVTARSGKKTKKIKIVVKKAVKKKESQISNAPTQITLIKSKEYIGIGETCTVSVLSVKPAAASQDVTYSSSNPSVAEVSPTGLITGNNIGKVRITARSVADGKITAYADLDVVGATAGVMTAEIDMSDTDRYPAGKAVKAWFPVPKSDNNQTITQVRHQALSAVREEITTDPSGNKAYYVEWGENAAPEDRKAMLSFHVYRRAVLHSSDLRSKEKGSVDTARFAEYLKQTAFSGSLTDGIVKETADKIVADAGAKTVYDKAFAIYTWVCENITRDKSVSDRELGDVMAVMNGTRAAGSCIDVNSVFVSLCNAAGIPARDSFGLKLTDKVGQNCRAEFYLPGCGWVEVDPAMVLGKIMYKEDEYRGVNAPNAADWKVLKETYWTTGGSEWVCLNHDRDVTLEPAQSAAHPDYMVNADGTLNHFMFPYGEFEGKYIPGHGTESEKFRYVYTFTPEDPRDCGC